MKKEESGRLIDKTGLFPPDVSKVSTRYVPLPAQLRPDKNGGLPCTTGTLRLGPDCGCFPCDLRRQRRASTAASIPTWDRQKSRTPAMSVRSASQYAEVGWAGGMPDAFSAVGDDVPGQLDGAGDVPGQLDDVPGLLDDVPGQLDGAGLLDDDDDGSSGLGSPRCRWDVKSEVSAGLSLFSGKLEPQPDAVPALDILKMEPSEDRKRQRDIEYEEAPSVDSDGSSLGDDADDWKASLQLLRMLESCIAHGSGCPDAAVGVFGAGGAGGLRSTWTQDPSGKWAWLRTMGSKRVFGCEISLKGGFMEKRTPYGCVEFLAFNDFHMRIPLETTEEYQRTQRYVRTYERQRQIAPFLASRSGGSASTRASDAKTGQAGQGRKRKQ
eukprot:TRINITY_DN2587_c0_g1_i1.p2 TRINITY_DN2587_c0_g1~~TRINITY_DN2587_c0_g1_i1.p2  ORF type:complete len:381 (+),score=106.59 TRINITY_DN2587_c0_g1_i1:398-1540(+)